MYIDADDFHEGNHRLELLKLIKEKIPNFKISLFTVPMLCSAEWLNEMRKIEWIDMIPHGEYHPDPYECSEWTYKQSKEYLRRIEPLGLTKGFKAPGWQISHGMYKALLEGGYWVADQPYNNNRRPKELPVYLLDSSEKHHFHVQNVCGNGIEESLQKILKLRGEFRFIKEIFDNKS